MYASTHPSNTSQVAKPTNGKCKAARIAFRLGPIVRSSVLWLWLWFSTRGNDVSWGYCGLAGWNRNFRHNVGNGETTIEFESVFRSIINRKSILLCVARGQKIYQVWSMISLPAARQTPAPLVPRFPLAFTLLRSAFTNIFSPRDAPRNSTPPAA